MNMTTVPSNQLKAMQHEIESLKEQVAITWGVATLGRAGIQPGAIFPGMQVIVSPFLEPKPAALAIECSIKDYLEPRGMKV